jgi:hypothetical protein
MVVGLQMPLYLLLTAAICLVLVINSKKALRMLARRQQPGVMDQGLALCILTAGMGEEPVWLYVCYMLSFLAGLTSPLAFLANYWILTLGADSEHRAFLCGVLIQTRTTVQLVYITTLIFSFFFRVFLILHADKGLVQKGSLNLRLFHQLYWVIVCSFLLVGHGVFSLPHLIDGTFQGTLSGQICLLQDISDDEVFKIVNLKRDLIRSVFPLIALVGVKYLSWRVKQFVSGLCPGGKMSCIGIYKRNVIKYHYTTQLLYFYIFDAIFYSVLSRTITYLGNTYSNTTIFWIWNTYGVFFDILVFFLPFSFVLPDGNISENRASAFYVRKPSPILDPRRQFLQQDITQKQTDAESSIPEQNKSYNCVMYCKFHGKAKILKTPSSIIGPPKKIQDEEWLDDCKGKWKGKGKGKNTVKPV